MLILGGCDSSSSPSSDTAISSTFGDASSSIISLTLSSSSSTQSSSLSSSFAISSSSSSITSHTQQRIEVTECSEVSDDAFTSVQSGDILHNEKADTIVKIRHSEDGSKSLCSTLGKAYILRG